MTLYFVWGGLRRKTTETAELGDAGKVQVYLKLENNNSNNKAHAQAACWEVGAQKKSPTCQMLQQSSRVETKTDSMQTTTGDHWKERTVWKTHTKIWRQLGSEQQQPGSMWSVWVMTDYNQVGARTEVWDNQLNTKQVQHKQAKPK